MTTNSHLSDFEEKKTKQSKYLQVFHRSYSTSIYYRVTPFILKRKIEVQ